jgi:tartrate dehydratase alpha subunit/fumarate hydratase class I-like protein
MLENTWTVIRVGINANNRHISSFHVRALMSPCEAKAHAIERIKGDWSNHRTDYLLDCINRGDFHVSHTAGA